MIESLSNPSWIKPQIDFLLFLQNFRVGQLEVFDKFFLSITVLGEFWLPTIICAITYWCIDFRMGIYLFSLESFNVLLAHLFKMLACVYRPWILDNRIHPPEVALPFARGYSFPSGHSAMGSSILGGVAYLLRKNKILCTIIIGLIFLIGFSRLWLGVHTPQDVVCGFLIGLILVFGVNFLINWAEKDKNRYLWILLTVNIFAVLFMVYVYCFNTYRMDYVAGELLVDPQKQKYIMIVTYGYSLGLINGSFLCRRFCPFEPKEVSVKRRILRGFIGTIAVILLFKYMFEYVIMSAIALKIVVLLMFILGLFVTLFYPLIFTKLRKL